MVKTGHAKSFVIILGLMFILGGIAISLIYDNLDVVSIGMGIIGIFLMLLPFTSVVKK